MDALEFLENQHAEVEDLFGDYDEAETIEEQEEIAREVILALRIHTTLEEEVFYPAVRESLPDLIDDILADLEEHHLVKILLDELVAMDGSDERFDAKMQVLAELVDHHVEEEEEGLFPELEEGFEEGDLVRLGEQMQQRGNELDAEFA